MPISQLSTPNFFVKCHLKGRDLSAFPGVRKPAGRPPAAPVLPSVCAFTWPCRAPLSGSEGATALRCVPSTPLRLRRRGQRPAAGWNPCWHVRQEWALLWHALCTGGFTILSGINAGQSGRPLINCNFRVVLQGQERDRPGCTSVQFN